ncbi:MAG: arginine--tRNA ligase [Clostridiaceae bacterium]|jgi:arginyl-tRNA synthetase|nr:arginine--tRNA ligase [Clostridiaceae bacterium]
MDYNYELARLIKTEAAVTEEILAMLEIPKQGQGDISLPCFKLSKALRKSPIVIAAELAEAFPGAPFIERAEALNGYLNFFLNRKNIADELKDIAAAGAEYGRQSVGAGKTVCVDYSSVNIAKPFHIGHLSSTAIGAALYRIYSYLGYEAVGINHLGDWGTQFGKLIYAYKAWGGDGKKVEKKGIEELTRLYVRFHEEAETNPALNEAARAWFKKIEDGDAEALELFTRFKALTLKEVGKIYERLNVKFDSYAGESFYNDKMTPVLKLLEEKGLLTESDGAKIVDLSAYDMPPCILVRADGATLYATRDLAAAFYRKNVYDFYKCLYVVAYQQNLHFKQIFKVLELMDCQWAKNMEHVAFGMVSLEDGAMSTRKGRVVWLKDVLKEAVKKAREIIEIKSPDLKNKAATAASVGIGAVIFSVLYNSRIKDITFSYEKILNFDGETSPYIQYTHARCRSVMEKAGVGGNKSKALKLNGEVDLSTLADDESFDVIRALLRFPEVLRDAADKNEPCYLSRYLIDLAGKYNRFYIANRIINAPERERAARLVLTSAVADTLKTGLGLLGIGAPPKM